MTDLIIDEALLFKVLKTTKGDRKWSLHILKNAGVEITEEQLEDSINGSSILKAYFGSDSPVVFQDEGGLDGEEALLRLPDGNGETNQADLSKVSAAQDEYIAAKGLEGVGFTSDDIQEMQSMSQLVGHSFRKTVDITHGVMITQLWKLHKRVDEIVEILNNDEEAERVEVTEKGEVIRYMSPRFTDQEKLEWQKELTHIVDEIRRISDSANSGAAIRLKAEMASRDATEKQERKPKRKLKSVNA